MEQSLEQHHAMKMRERSWMKEKELVQREVLKQAVEEMSQDQDQNITRR